MKRGLVVIIIALLVIGFSWVEADGDDEVAIRKQRHVVGEDRGWDASSDIESWSSERIFMVGDDIWFAYSAAEEMIAELRSKEEFESCNVSNPIRTYTDGLNIVPLEDEGPRYFASSSSHKCKNGLKLRVHVIPIRATRKPLALAQPPKPSSAPSAPLSIYSIVSTTLIFWTILYG